MGSNSDDTTTACKKIYFTTDQSNHLRTTKTRQNALLVQGCCLHTPPSKSQRILQRLAVLKPRLESEGVAKEALPQEAVGEHHQLLLLLLR